MPEADPSSILASSMKYKEYDKFIVSLLRIHRKGQSMTEYTNETLVDLIKTATEKADRKEYLEALYQQNYMYIRKMCKRYAGRSGQDDIDDLTQEAFFGLRVAVDRYDPEQGTPFINYAATWIDQVLHRYLENCGNVIRVPTYLYNSILKYRKTEKVFLQDHGRMPTDDELIELMSLKDHAQLRRIKDRADILGSLSLDKQVISEDGAETFADVIPDPADHYEEVTDQMDEDQKRREVWEEVDALGDRKAKVVKMRFRDNMTLEAIGEVYGVSRERARQIQNAALKELSRSEKLRMWNGSDDYLSAKAYSGTGLSTFRNTGMSSPERAVIDIYNQSVRSHVRKTERRYKRMQKKTTSPMMMDV